MTELELIQNAIIDMQKTIEMPLECDGIRHNRGKCKGCAKNRELFRVRAALREGFERL